jgi:hypothetical protein
MRWDVFKLRLPKGALPALVGRYEYSPGNLFDLKPKIDQQGFLTKEDLWAVARWKSPRSAGHTKKNADDYVREISGIALSSKNERTRIEILCLLNGVQWPSASVILHFFHKDPYPILDFRALYSLSIDEPPTYTFAFWWQYVEFCRSLARRSKLTMRDLDRALWQYSKENQEAV